MWKKAALEFLVYDCSVIYDSYAENVGYRKRVNQDGAFLSPGKFGAECFFEEVKLLTEHFYRYTAVGNESIARHYPQFRGQSTRIGDSE